MSQDYANRGKRKDKKQTGNTRSKQGESTRHPWRVLLLLIILLLLIAFVLCFVFFHHKSTARSVSISKNNNISVVTATPVINHVTGLASTADTTLTAEKKAPPKKVQFDFYNTLPKMTVAVPKQTAAPINTTQQTYLVQIASFFKQQQAQDSITHLKAQGFNARIHTVSRGNQMIYRIQMGPYDNSGDAEAVQNKLQLKNISSLLVLAQ